MRSKLQCDGKRDGSARYVHRKTASHQDVPPRSKQCRVEQIGTVGRADDEDVVPALPLAHAVKLGKELTHDAVHDASRVALIPALGRDRVELVEKDHAGLGVARALEHAPHIGF